MQYGTRVFFLYCCLWARKSASAVRRLSIYRKKSYGISKFWAFMMSCTIEMCEIASLHEVASGLI